jgi:uncharacterized protein with beta-barrel porin domain
VDSGAYTFADSAGGRVSGRPLRSATLCLLLASSSVAALLIGGGTQPAFAVCANTVGPGAVASFTNPSGQTIACVTFNNATVSGNVVNAGTITPGGPSGIQFSNSSTINGSVSNSGTISVSGAGIDAESGGNGVTFFGGITSSGTITAGGDGIRIVATSTFAGGITNIGVIKSGDTGIQINEVLTFAGGITNTGTLSAAADNGIVFRALSLPQTFIGNISNGGTITAPGAGILATGQTTGLLKSTLTSFGGAIVNSGTINGGQTGIKVNIVQTFTSGITNNGSIVATAKTGILVNGFSGSGGSLSSTFAGGIVGTGTISAGTYGIKLTGVSNFSGGISSGPITALADTGIAVTSVSTFTGNITSTGSITAAKDGILIEARTVSFFNGNIVNQGTITSGPNFGGIVVFDTNTGAGNPNITFTGNITNNGRITASGTGADIEIADANVLNGGIVNTGTLSAAAAAAGAIAINNGVFGTATLGIVNSSTGVISSAGLAAIFVEGQTILGGITNAGTISDPNGKGIFLVGTQLTTFMGGITNNGTITAKTGILAGAQTFSGPIVNTGNITGTGGTALAANSSTDALTVDQEAGTITGNISLLSSNADVLNVTGGVINGNIAGAGTQIINFALGSGTTFTYGFDFTSINTVNINSGTVVLDGVDSATSVEVNNGGTLAGTGTIDPLAVTINSGATLAPGTPGGLGTLSINGNLIFESGSFYAINIAPGAGNNSKTAVTGSANLGGNGTVVVTPVPGHYSNAVYQILTTTTPLTGQFAGLTINGSFTGTMALDYATNSPDDVDLDVTGASLFTVPAGTNPNLNQNQQNVLNAINAGILASPANTPLAPQFVSIGNLSGPAFLNALDQLEGQPATGAQTSAFQLMTDFVNLLTDPSSGGGGSPTGGGAPGFAPEQEASLPSDIAEAYASILTKAPPPQSFAQRWSAWGSAYGGAAKFDGNAVIGSNDVTASDYGFAAGMDYRATPDSVYGFALAGGGTNWSVAQNLGTGRSDSFLLGVHDTTRWGSFYLSGALAFANHWFTTNRTAVGDQLQAHFDGQSYAARGEAGYRYAVPVTGAIIGVTPYAALQAQDFHTPSFSETDLTGGGLGLSFASQNGTDTRSELGARFDNVQIVDAMPLVLRARVAWAHDWISNSSLGAVFQALPGSNFTVNGAAPPTNSALTTASAELHITTNWTAIAKFDGEFAQTAQTYAGTGTLKYTW